MTKAPTPTEKLKQQRDNTKMPPKTSITQRLQTDLERSIGETDSTIFRPFTHVGFKLFSFYIYSGLYINICYYLFIWQGGNSVLACLIST